MLNLIQLSYFCTLYKEQNYSKAAEKLFLSRQALKKSVSSLEDEIGGELFERDQTRLKPTKLAEYLYPEAFRLLESEKRISENLQKYARSQIHTLRIGATFSALETVAPTLPFDFQNKYPGVSLNIQTIPDGDLEPMVEREEIDCAFVIGPPDDPKRMYSLLLGSQPLFLIMLPEMRPNGEYISLEEMSRLPLLTVPPRFKVQHQLMKKFSDAGLKPNIRFESSDFSLLVTMCERGEGAVPIPKNRLNTVNSNVLTSIQINPEEDPRWDVFYLRRNTKEVPYALRLLEDTLHELKKRGCSKIALKNKKPR